MGFECEQQTWMGANGAPHRGGDDAAMVDFGTNLRRGAAHILRVIPDSLCAAHFYLPAAHARTQPHADDYHSFRMDFQYRQRLHSGRLDFLPITCRNL